MANKNNYKRWSLTDDNWLWKNRNTSIITLSGLCSRYISSVASRLQHLRDPKHNANHRLMLYRGKYIGTKVIHCNLSHGTLQHAKNNNHNRQLTNKPCNKWSVWNIEDDICLNNNKDCCYDDLARHHGRTTPSIRTRMTALANPNSSVSQRLSKPKTRQPNHSMSQASTANTSNKGKRWTIQDDRDLWRFRDCSVQHLAQRFSRTKRSIMFRLADLRDPKHKANVRLAAHDGKRDLVCTGSVTTHRKPFAIEDDLCLFSNRDCCVSLLAKHFHSTSNRIKDELAKLTDGNHVRRIKLDKHLKKDNTSKKRCRNDKDEKIRYVKKRKVNADMDDDEEDVSAYSSDDAPIVRKQVNDVHLSEYSSDDDLPLVKEKEST
eukprot:259561_1